MLRILFVDDHIPDNNIPDGELVTHYLDILQKNFHDYPYTEAAFRDRAVRGYPAMRQALKGLKSDNFDVVCENTFKDGMKRARTQKFDIAIVDLGWYLDPAVDSSERESAGWKIINEIFNADRVSGRTTACILYSNRLVDDRGIVSKAAELGVLPVLKHIEGDKSPVDVAVDGLRAAASYLAATIEQASGEKAFWRRAREIESWSSAVADEALRNFRRWSAIISVAFVVSLVLIGSGIILALTGSVKIGIVTSVTSTVTAVFSQLARPWYRESQKNVVDMQEKLLGEIKNFRAASSVGKAAA